jgi:hypothetical protein
MLSGDEAQLQADIFGALSRRGAKGLRDQGGVYPFLLREVARAMHHERRRQSQVT